LRAKLLSLRARNLNEFWHTYNNIKHIFEKDKTNNLFCLHAMQNHTRWTLNSSSSIVKHCQNMLNNNKLVWMRVYYGYIFGKRFTKKYKLNIIIVQEANLNLKRELCYSWKYLTLYWVFLYLAADEILILEVAIEYCLFVTSIYIESISKRNFIVVVLYILLQEVTKGMRGTTHFLLRV
jgi:hypothetical protein